MGANMVRRLQAEGMRLVFDRSPNAVKDLVKEIAIGAVPKTYSELAKRRIGLSWRDGRAYLFCSGRAGLAV